ncbi:MAG: integrase arm-type DNA-binding domain-containing protein [Devosia sp.]
MGLSDFALRNAKPKDRAYRLADGDGLNLLVRPGGSKLWQLRYGFMSVQKGASEGRLFPRWD